MRHDLNIDWELFRKQKECLVGLVSEGDLGLPDEVELIEGVIHLMDAIQDQLPSGVLTFLRTVANMILEGEDDGDGGEFVMECDDSITALVEVVEEARRIESGLKLEARGRNLEDLEEGNPYSCHLGKD